MEPNESIQLDALIRHLQFWAEQHPGESPACVVSVNGKLRPFVGDFTQTEDGLLVIGEVL